MPRNDRKNYFQTALLFILICLTNALEMKAQTPETFTQKGYTLRWINQDPKLDPALKKRLIQTYFDVYPTLVKTFNPKAAREVTFLIDTAYGGVAEASGIEVRFSAAWLHRYPGDIDVVTHEVMHIVQSYPGDAGPGWLTEGIADYVRHVYGVDNAGGGWSMPAYAPDQHYENAYRITARFLLWLEKQAKPGIVKTLDRAMRTKTYTEEIWRQQTGMTLADLWKKYAQNPTI
jgi:hypothetical protein